MATVVDLLSQLLIFDNSLRVAAGEPDEARAITALSMAQHQMEALATNLPRVLQTTVNVGQTANTESTAWSSMASTLLRLDALWLLSDDTALPIRKMKRIEEVGGHIPSLPWPMQLVFANTVGVPSGYYANTHDFYWLPLPDGTHALRVYGLVEQAEFATRSSTFNYPLRCKMPIAQFAAKLLRVSTDDDDSSLDTLAAAIFKPVLKGLKNFDRSEPHGRTYRDIHTT